MATRAQQIARLRRIIDIAGKLIDEFPKGKRGRPAMPRAAKANGTNGTKRKRRAGKELRDFRRMLKAERKAGVPVAKLAKKHGISPAYIYQL